MLPERSERLSTPRAIPRSYIIDVCITCGAHAVYPFRCGHRSETERWTVPITVVATTSSMTVLGALRSSKKEHDRHGAQRAPEDEQQGGESAAHGDT